MLHLLLDGMWTTAETLFWPFFGIDFAPGATDYWTGFVHEQLLQPSNLVQELAGASYLVYLWRGAGLGDPTVRKRFWIDGRLSS